MGRGLGFGGGEGAAKKGEKSDDADEEGRTWALSAEVRVSRRWTGEDKGGIGVWNGMERTRLFDQNGPFKFEIDDERWVHLTGGGVCLWCC